MTRVEKHEDKRWTRKFISLVYQIKVAPAQVRQLTLPNRYNPPTQQQQLPLPTAAIAPAKARQLSLMTHNPCPTATIAPAQPR